MRFLYLLYEGMTVNVRLKPMPASLTAKGAKCIFPTQGGVRNITFSAGLRNRMVQSFINLPFVICLKPSTKAGATRILSIALSHARKSSAAKDNPAKFEQSNKAPNPYALEQVKAPIQRVEGVVWETPVILIGLYGMRRFEILGFCWRNEELGNNMFDISEQIPFKALLKEMTLPKSDGRKLFITEFAAQEAQCEQAERDGKAYYDNDLVLTRPDGALISAF